MKISVVIATYNGEKYVAEQLKSIINQTRQPDEVIVMDDHSTDNTARIARNILREAPNISSSIIINKENKGWRKNFVEGFHRATGEVIFCADQDDVWYDNRLEIMENIMAKDSNIKVLACNIMPLYEKKSKEIAVFYIQNYGSKTVERVDLKSHGLTVLRPGCAMCFRSSLIPWVDTVWAPQLAHDEVLWAVGVTTRSLFILNETLMRFRRHASNNSPSNAKRLKHRMERAECELLKINNILDNHSIINIDKEQIEWLKQQKLFDEKRIRAFTERSLIKGLCLLREKSRYITLRAWVADMICIVRG